MDKVLILLEKLWKAHLVYKEQKNVMRQIKIYGACEFLFKELEELKVPRSFSEAFLCFGDEFLVAEFGVPFTKSKNGEYYLDKLC